MNQSNAMDQGFEPHDAGQVAESSFTEDEIPF
jgi:hypothetical protein